MSANPPRSTDQIAGAPRVCEQLLSLYTVDNPPSTALELSPPWIVDVCQVGWSSARLEYGMLTGYGKHKWIRIICFVLDKSRVSHFEIFVHHILAVRFRHRLCQVSPPWHVSKLVHALLTLEYTYFWYSWYSHFVFAKIQQVKKRYVT